MSHHVFGSDGLSLRFEPGDEALQRAYEKDIAQIQVNTYKALRLRHGVYASNQGRYVPDASYLNRYDCRRMEERANEDDKAG